MATLNFSKVEYFITEETLAYIFLTDHSNKTDIHTGILIHQLLKFTTNTGNTGILINGCYFDQITITPFFLIFIV